MKSRKLFDWFITATMVTCAVIITILVVRNELMSEQNNNHQSFYQTEIDNRYIKNWRDLVLNNRQDQITKDVQLIEFIDFSCPYCRELEMTLESIFNSSSNISVSRTQYYLPRGDESSDSWSAAKFAVCTNREDVAYNINLRLYEIVQEIKPFQFNVLADEFNLNFEEVDDCMNSPIPYNAISHAKSIAREYSIEYVPSLIINGYLFEGLTPGEMILRKVDLIEKDLNKNR